MRQALLVLALVAAYAMAARAAPAAAGGAGVFVTLVSPRELPAGATLRLYVETPDGRIIEKHFSVASAAERTRAPEATPPAAAPPAPPPAPMTGSDHDHSRPSASAAPAATVMERRRSEPASPTPAMAGSDHAHSGSSREPAPGQPQPAPSPAPAAGGIAAIRTLGPIRVRLMVRTAGGGLDVGVEDRVYFAPLPAEVTGAPFDGAVVLESNGALTNVRFQTR